MNKKVLITGIVSLALSLCLMIGCTFALFTSESSTNVTVSSGKVKVVSTINDEVKTYSRDVETENGVFANNGTAVLTKNKTLVLTNVTPGDKAELTINVKNESNVAIKYRVKALIEGDLASALETKVTFPGEQDAIALMASSKTAWADMDNNAALEVKVSVELPISAINEYMDKTAEITVVVEAVQANGTDLLKTEITSEQLKEILSNGVSEQAGEVTNVTINIDKDYVVTDGENWTPFTLVATGKVTVQGNLNTISGLGAPLFAEGDGSATEVIVNDLTLDDVSVDSANSDGVGAIYETVYYKVRKLTLNNCHLINSTVIGSRTGGLVGWAGAPGGVSFQIDIINCSVESCKINGKGTVGGIVGHSTTDSLNIVTITNCIVKECTLISYDDSYRVGAIVGTANTGTTIIKNCSSQGNTLKQDNNDVEITRPEGQSDLYGRAPGGKLIIDGVEVK